MIAAAALLLTLQAAPSGATITGPQPVTVPSAQMARPPQRRRPAASLFTADDYPASAIGSGAHGKVAVALLIDTIGRIVACRIVHSSGSSALDQATCNILQRRSRYDPAISTDGHPMLGAIGEVIDWPAR